MRLTQHQNLTIRSGLTTFGNIMYNSFGFTRLQVLLVDIPRSGKNSTNQPKHPFCKQVFNPNPTHKSYPSASSSPSESTPAASPTGAST